MARTHVGNQIHYGNTGRDAIAVELVSGASGDPASAGGGGSSVGGTPYSVSFSRPADTTAYAAGDVIAPTSNLSTGLVAGEPITFAGVGAAGAQITVTSLTVMASKKDDGSRYALYLYTAKPSSVADNAAMPFLFANAAHFWGFLATDPLASGTDTTNSTGAFGTSSGQAVAVTLEDANLYGFLVPLDATAVTSGESYVVRITVA